MKALLSVAGFFAVLAGFYYVFRAADAVSVSTEALAAASAVQISQVYNAGTYFGVMAGVCFVFALLCVVAGANRTVKPGSA